MESGRLSAVDTLIGTSLGGYTLVKFLGSGGMGTVYLAEDLAIGQQVAIKIVRADATDYLDSTNTLQAIERFKQEARAVARLDHIHILPLYRYGEEETVSGPRAYIVMQYRPEGSLRDLLRRRANLAASQSLASAPVLPAGLGGSWPLSLEEAGEYVRQVASALQYAHDQGIVHRDIKPANFLLRIQPGNTVHLLLSDFGLAKFFTTNSATSTILGTPIYMAPEQFEGEAGPESDQYALAVMIYQFLAGHPPFEGEPMQLMHQHISMEPPPIRTFVPTLPLAIELVFARALAKNPAKRFPSIAAFAEAFAQGICEKSRAFAPPFSLPTALQQDGGRAGASTSSLPASSNGEPVATYLASGQQIQLKPLAEFNTPTIADMPPVQAHSPAFAPTEYPKSASPEGYHSHNQPFQHTLTPFPQTGAALPPPRKNMSRRSALGWIAGGIAAVGAGGIGLYFYTRNRTPPHALHVLRGHSNSVTSVKWSPDGTQLLSGSRDHTARLWLDANGQNTVTYNGHTSAVLSVAWSSDGSVLASGSWDKTVQVWDSRGTLQQQFSLAAAVSSVIWRMDSAGLLAGTLGNGIHELSLSTGRITGQTLRSTVRAIALSPDGSFFAAALENGNIALLNMREQPHRIKHYYTGHTGPVLALAWSIDSAMLASGSADTTTRVWDVATGQTVHTLPHKAAVTGVSWEPATVARLATGCTDRHVSIWHVDSSARTIYSGHRDAVTSVSWGPLGLASGSVDHDIIIWQV
jgi:eukaryotic-like serine/threonine-protein kinase